MKEIILTEKLRDIVSDFAYESTKTTIDNYKNNRNQGDPTKVKMDAFYGKMAEFAVFSSLVKKYDICQPDLSIYSSHQKSFDPDLTMINNNKVLKLHVKTQHIDSSKKYGMSWCFQPEDILTTNPDDNDMICLCITHDLRKVEILKYVKASDIIKKLKEPQLDHLKGLKRVLYYDDI